MPVNRSTLLRPLVAVTMVAASSLFAIAQQPPTPSRVRGTIESVDGDVIAVKAGTTAEQVIRDATELTGQVPAWLQADHDGLTAKVLRKPERREVAAPVQEQLIVELYSK